MKRSEPHHVTVETRGTGGPTILALLGLLATGASRMVVAVLIGRVGGPSLLGSTQASLSTAQLFALTWPSAASAAATKHLAAARGQGDTEAATALRRHLQHRGATVSVGLMLLSACVAWGLLSADADVIVLTCCLTVGLCGYTLGKGLVLGAGRPARSAALEILASTIAVTGVSALLAFDVRSPLVMLPVGAGFLAYSVGSWSRVNGRDLTLEERRSIRSFMALGVVGTLASAGLAQSAVLVASWTGGSSLAGQYAAAMALAAPASLLGSALGLALFPMMAELAARGDTRAVAIHTTRSTGTMMFVVMWVVAPAALLSPLVIDILWGGGYETAGTIAPILLLVAGLSAVAGPSVNALTSASHRGMAISATTTVAGAVCGVLVWLLTVPIRAEIGVPVGYATGVAIAALAPVAVVARSDGIRQHARWLRFIFAYTTLAFVVYQVSDLALPALLGLASAFGVAWTCLDAATARRLFHLAVQTRNGKGADPA